MENYVFAALLSLLIPLSYLLLASRGKAVVASLLWLIWPIFVLIAIIIWEIITRPAVPDALNNALLGISLITAFLLIPWLAFALPVLAICLFVRRFYRPAPVLTPIAPAGPGPSAVEPPPCTASDEQHTQSQQPAVGLITGTVEGSLHTSPDGTIRVETFSAEWSNSHWVWTPRVTDLLTGEVVLDLTNTDWDASISFPAPRQTRLSMRRYHAGGGLTVMLDHAQQLYHITAIQDLHETRQPAPLSDVLAGLEEASRCSSASLTQRRPPTIKPRLQKSQTIAIFAVMIAMALIGLIFVRHGDSETTQPANSEIITVPEGGFRPR